MKKPTVSVVLGSYNRLRFLKAAIKSIRKELVGFPHEIVIVDGGSSDGSIQWLTKQKDVLSIVQHNHGKWHGKPIERKSWGYFMNLAFRVAQGKYICMVSDDCLIVPGAIINGIDLFNSCLNKGTKVGAVAFYWRNWPEEENYSVKLTLGNKMFVNHGLYLRTALQEIDYIDEESFLFYCADGDLCIRLWEAGYSCIDSPDSYIEHRAHVSRGMKDSNYLHGDKDWEVYCKKWPKLASISHDGGIKKTHIDSHYTIKKFIKIDPIFWILWPLISRFSPRNLAKKLPQPIYLKLKDFYRKNFVK